ncbi:MAG: twin-arginine translocase TatA/TatE family subunit [Paramuribaculum sp.]|nr:twin-arginine translocase TatA/TatE family subunit [Paramuribaculum sp.]
MTLIPLFLGNLRGSEILIIALIILLLFGGKKIPELMRGIGKGVKSFRQGMNEINNEINRDNDSSGKTDSANEN